MAAPRSGQYEGERDEARFWAAAIPEREPALQRGYVPALLLTLIASVPWYWPGEAPIWWGMPAWVWVAIACSAVASALTAWAILVHWRDPIGPSTPGIPPGIDDPPGPPDPSAEG